MSLLIILRSPVFGYCPEYQIFFLGYTACKYAHDCEDHSSCHHHDHGECPDEEGCHHEDCQNSDHHPCDENHKMISLESDDFLWSRMVQGGEPKVVSAQEEQAPVVLSLDFPKGGQKVISSPRAPPPPDGPIFLRFSVLRL